MDDREPRVQYDPHDDEDLFDEDFGDGGTNTHVAPSDDHDIFDLDEAVHVAEVEDDHDLYGLHDDIDFLADERDEIGVAKNSAVLPTSALDTASFHDDLDLFDVGDDADEASSLPPRSLPKGVHLAAEEDDLDLFDI
jgi:hypothetical protein